MQARKLIIMVSAGFAALLSLLPSGQAQGLQLPTSFVERAKLETLTAEGWIFNGSSADAPRETVSPREVVRWGAWPGILKQQAVWLSDGSWLTGELQIEGQSINVHNDWLSTPAFDLNTVRGLVISPPSSPAKWSEVLKLMREASGEQDIIWLRGGSRISGVVRWEASASKDSFVVESRNQTIEILLDDVMAIVFSPALLGPTSASGAELGAVGLLDGTLMNVDQLELVADRVELRLSSGVAIQSLDGPTEFAQAVVYLQGAPENVSYLSDLEPASYRNLSDNRLQWQLGRDLGVNGAALRQGEGFVAKGLAIHSSSQVAYRWSGKAARLLAEVRMAPSDPTADSRLGSVRCQVLLARDGVLETVREFDLAREASRAPISEVVNVDITNAQLVVLIVEKSDFGQYADHVFWLDARIAAP